MPVDRPVGFLHDAAMRIDVLHRLRRLTLSVGLALALAATGFGHHIPKAQEDVLAIAVANGLTAADYCGDLPGMAREHCLACQTVGAADLPPAVLSHVALRLRPAGRTHAPRQSATPNRALDPVRSPQGPPVA